MNLYSEQQIAKKLGYDRATIAKWRKENKIHPVGTKGDNKDTYLYDFEAVKHLSKGVDK